MKKLLFAVCALAAISVLAPDAGYAQWENRIGIYADDAAGSASIETTPLFTPFNIYFILSAPREDDGTPFTAIDAFQFRVTMDGPAGGVFRLSENIRLPGQVTVGEHSNPYDSDYSTGGAAPLPVVNDRVVLMDWQLMANNAGPYVMYLVPSVVASVPGQLAFNITTGEGAILQGAMPSSGAMDVAVFGIGTGVTPTESETFGAVKALFR